MALFWFLVALCLFLIYICPASPRDDTDPPEGRSGMALFIDNRTGCHYLGNPLGGITPRLDGKGRHICEGKAQ